MMKIMWWLVLIASIGMSAFAAFLVIAPIYRNFRQAGEFPFTSASPVTAILIVGAAISMAMILNSISAVIRD